MDLVKNNAVQLQNLLFNNQTTSEQIVQAYFDQIETLDSSETSFVSVTKEQAKQAAIESDKRRKENKLLSKWDGVPITLKDNISTKDIKTTNGSKGLSNYIPPFDATIVNTLKTLGMPILGKTTCPEFNIGFNDKHDGSITAVKTNQAPWALSTDTGGSPRELASNNGLFSFKPSYGLVSRYGLMATAPSLDHVSPIANTLEDTAALLEVIADYDPKDTSSIKIDIPSYTKQLGQDIKNFTIGLPKELWENCDSNIKENIEMAVNELQNAGAQVKEISLPHVKFSAEAYYLITSEEICSSLAGLDGVRFGLRVDAEDSNSMFKKTRAKAFNYETKQRILLGTAFSAGMFADIYKKALQVRTLIKTDFGQAFNDVDFFVTPTVKTRAKDSTDDPIKSLENNNTIAANLTGSPALTMPISANSGLQIIGKHFEEQKILQLAYTLQSLTKGGSDNE